MRHAFKVATVKSSNRIRSYREHWPRFCKRRMPKGWKKVSFHFDDEHRLLFRCLIVSPLRV